MEFQNEDGEKKQKAAYLTNQLQHFWVELFQAKESTDNHRCSRASDW